MAFRTFVYLSFAFIVWLRCFSAFTFDLGLIILAIVGKITELVFRD